MDMSARVFELNQYCTDPVKLAAREAMFGEALDLLNTAEPKFPIKKKGKKK
jgi:hypothetical protein